MDAKKQCVPPPPGGQEVGQRGEPYHWQSRQKNHEVGLSFEGRPGLRLDPKKKETREQSKPR